MNSKIVETLETMCDMDNPQDRKLLLLAELVETKCNSLAENQRELIRNLEETKSTLSKTGEKLDKLTMMLESNNSEAHSCPVYKNKGAFEKLSTLMNYPKLLLFAAVGFLAMLAGIVGTKAIDALKLLFGL